MSVSKQRKKDPRTLDMIWKTVTRKNRSITQNKEVISTFKTFPPRMDKKGISDRITTWCIHRVLSNKLLIYNL